MAYGSRFEIGGSGFSILGLRIDIAAMILLAQLISCCRCCSTSSYPFLQAFAWVDLVRCARASDFSAGGFEDRGQQISTCSVP